MESLVQSAARLPTKWQLFPGLAGVHPQVGTRRRVTAARPGGLFNCRPNVPAMWDSSERVAEVKLNATKAGGAEGQLKVLMAAGGTGGHAYPAIAIADEIRRLCSGEVELKVMGSKDRMESSVVRRAGYEIRAIPAVPLSRPFAFFDNLLVPAKLLWALFSSWQLLRQVRPHIVVETGGYFSSPLYLVAASMGFPVVVQEQNAYAGLTNRLIGNVTEAVFIAFSAAIPFFPEDHCDLTTSYARCGADSPSPRPSSPSGFRRKTGSRRRGSRRRAKHVHCSALNSGVAVTSVALLSGEALSEPALPNALQGDFEPGTPLCERPGTSIAALIDVYRWRIGAQKLATSVGSEFIDADGGPEVSDLLRELEWLLDDAVAACSASDSDNLSRQSSAWKPCAWRDIKAFQIVDLERDSSVAGSGDREDLSADASALYGAFGALCRERHTDPVNEFAADLGCSCDGIRESLAEMASTGELTDSQARISSISLLDFISKKVQENVHGRRNSKAGLQILLRMSIKELDKAWKERIQKRRPFQYVVGAAHWREYVLGVAEGVLIPRPETEQMVDLVEGAISADKSLGQGIWADLGTGSGAIAIALARLLGPSGSVMAIDASSAAVLVATRNIERYSLQNKVKVLQGFWFSPLQDKRGELAGVVSNPPYIPSDRLAGLQAEVGKHEPRIALDGGPDGMNDLREICRGSATALRQGGFLALETNGGEQAEILCDLISKMRVLGSSGIALSCFRDVKSVKDFAGITRFVTAIRC